ncbi:MAG: hypothetical protein AAF526_08605 [Pseudomonadota bacterium]
MSGITVLPLHYGLDGQPWPPGIYYIVELRRTAALTLYWCDAASTGGVAGWSFTALRAAGFASEDDAKEAFSSRGRVPFRGHLVFTEHDVAS